MKSQALFERHVHVGRLEWIGLAPARGEPHVTPDTARVEVGTGLVGDHHARTGKGKRQVTLIQKEHFAVVAGITGLPVEPAMTRRNLVVSGINLYTLRKQRFRIGEVEFEGTGECPPCDRMESTVGPGAYQALRGHAGITARVLQGGEIRLGDPVEVVRDETPSD